MRSLERHRVDGVSTARHGMAAARRTSSKLHGALATLLTRIHERKGIIDVCAEGGVQLAGGPLARGATN